MKEDALKVLLKVLKDNGFSITAPRRLVFDLLWDSEPQSMHDLEDRAEGQADRASLYRTVTLFTKLGLVHRIALGWKYKIELSDLFTHHHHHMTCLNCHKIIPINETELENFINSLARQHDFDISEHQVELQGYCKKCKTNIKLTYVPS